MTPKRSLASLCLLLFATSICVANSRPGRRVSFNQNWRIHLTDVVNRQDVSLNDSNWALTLPHDWSIEGDFSEKHSRQKWNACTAADNLISFEPRGQGSIVGVDNGNQISHESFKRNQRRALHGMALAIVQSKQKPGRFLLRGTADGLTPGSIIINVR